MISIKTEPDNPENVKKTLEKVDQEAPERLKAVPEDERKEAAEILKKYGPYMDWAANKALDEFKRLQPYILDEIKKRGIKKSVDLFDKAGDTTVLADIIAAAQKQEKENNITAEKLKQFEYPKDKITQKTWNGLSSLQRNCDGEIVFALQGNDAPTRTSYDIAFDIDQKDGIEITKELTPFDKRVFLAVCNLYRENGEMMTLGQIADAMGYGTRINKKIFEKIHSSLTKMGMARVFIKNLSISEKKITEEYDFHLLAFSRLTARINNKICRTAIRVLEEPQYMKFVKSTKQITTIPPAILKSPLSKTDTNIMIEDYLINQITAMKHNPNYNKKIKFKTVCEHCNQESKMQQSRTPAKIYKFLDHCAACNWINSYSKKPDGVTVKP